MSQVENNTMLDLEIVNKVCLGLYTKTSYTVSLNLVAIVTVS